MEYLNYLIYPIAGLLCFLALGGLNTKQPIVIIASAISLALNGYAIIDLVWWPIPVSIGSDFVFKKLFGDPGVVTADSQSDAADHVDLYMLGADPLVWGKRDSAFSRAAVQIFVLGMVDMRRNAAGLSYDQFVATYGSALAKHNLSPSVPVSEFVNAIGQAASENAEVANVMKEGAMSIKRYVVERDAGAVNDLARAVQYVETHKPVFEPLTSIS